MNQIKFIDDQATLFGLDAVGWSQRYNLEQKYMKILEMEESYWAQRGHVHWLQEGHANTSYFHSVANGRRRKNFVFSLDSDQGVLSECKDIE